MRNFHFEPGALPPEVETLRTEVRDFLAAEMQGRMPDERVESWSGFDPEFSTKVGARGWIAMTWPRKYGGHERTAFERYVVLEEMLAAGAPVGAHWVADRQSGPLLLRCGTEAQRQQFLPRIARGELYFAIGMSEPDSGSDLASVRTRAERDGNGFRVNGRKVWTSNAHRCQWMIALVRTHHDPENKHAGLSQMLIDTASPGMSIRPILDLTGRHHFNEILFEDVFVPRDMLVGDEGAGWGQVVSELAFERSGPERYLSSFELLLAFMREIGEVPGERAAVALGRLVAHLVTLRQMSLSVAGMLQAGQNPGLEAALVKDLGTAFEQELPEVVRLVLDVEPHPEGTAFERVLAHLTQVAPSFSLRGGTREILRGMIARGLGLR
ncbi:MAG TPA: acyl-CoA dehydrogenase family protein [Candidatus Binatia bacterium]|nr:acyl-CoA dehydrogenase family protein [Candidatus Binatia bacterium]